MALAAETLPATHAAIIRVRAATSDERQELVPITWLRSYTKSDIGRAMEVEREHSEARDRYWRGQGEIVRRLLADPKVEVRVATIQDVVVGWVCDAPDQLLVHYVYVKPMFRRQGVAKELLAWTKNKESVYCTHLAPYWIRNEPTWPKNLHWSPFSLFTGDKT